jgi:hypothetical protein
MPNMTDAHALGKCETSNHGCTGKRDTDWPGLTNGVAPFTDRVVPPSIRMPASRCRPIMSDVDRAASCIVWNAIEFSKIRDS